MINFIKNIFLYRKFLWNNRWFDSYFIFYMLREKFKVDSKYYKKYGIHLYKQNEIDEMEFCIKLLNRIIKDEYLNRALMFFEKKYSDWMDYVLIDDKKWFRRCSKRANSQEKQDIKYLFEYLNKHTKGWWD